MGETPVQFVILAPVAQGYSRQRSDGAISAESEGKMSFETWLAKADIPVRRIGISHVRDGFEAGRAESEAQIVALQSQVAILEESNKGYQRTAQTILEIKTERDALIEAIEIYERVLCTPASGEPARKP